MVLDCVTFEQPRNVLQNGNPFLYFLNWNKIGLGTILPAYEARAEIWYDERTKNRFSGLRS